MNEVIKSLLSHRSIRMYQDKAVQEDVLEQIIKAVQAAPNWINLQHVSVIAIKDKERREMFSELCGNQKHIPQAPVFLIFCADFYRTWLACQRSGQAFEETVSQIACNILGKITCFHIWYYPSTCFNHNNTSPLKRADILFSHLLVALFIILSYNQIAG